MNSFKPLHFLLGILAAILGTAFMAYSVVNKVDGNNLPSGIFIAITVIMVVFTIVNILLAGNKLLE